MLNPIYDIPVQNIEGQEVSLAEYQGKAMLIVNVATLCGFTPQYKGLEALYRQYHSQGFVILGFPCNQFAHQEPGSEEEIKAFCASQYHITFPLFAKLEVNGDKTHPLYAYLKKAKPGLLGTEAIKWNFTKFLINRQGEVIERFSPQTSPEDLVKSIEQALV
jgi:glutathione peroxidase